MPCCSSICVIIKIMFQKRNIFGGGDGAPSAVEELLLK